MSRFAMRRFHEQNRRLATGIMILWTVLNVLAGVTKCEYDYCYDDVTNEYLACHPSMYDVMVNDVAKVRVDPPTATCGSPVSYFRRLAPRGSVNETCDASNFLLKHPPNFMIDDNTTSWWQSVNMSPGTSELNINITLSFNKTFRMNSDVIITFNSGRPDKMVLEKSTDFGVTWKPLQYYAKNCADFQAQLVPGAAITADDPTAVICTSMYRETTPRAVAGRSVKFVNEDRFDLFLGPLKINFTGFYEALEQKLLDFLLFTDLRIRLIQPLNDGKGIFDMYYYAISDIQAVARCFCNLHAANCNYTDTDIICDCEHNTMGKNCEMCRPLYNERPWQKGSYIPYPKGQANHCIKCECNEHAESCTYNATYGRGICDVCLHNTRGYHCELCVLEYYPNMSLPLSAKERCIACDCELLGVLDGNLVCSQSNENGGPEIGQCTCKALTTGRRCDMCKPGYYGLKTGPVPGNCTECNCNLAGTVGESNTCTQDTGQCPCKNTTEHRTCDACKDGYYSFPTDNHQRECFSCNCDKGGSLSAICDKLNGSCVCRKNVNGLKCDQPTPGTFIPAVDVLTYQPLPGVCNVTSDLYTDQQPFDGTKFAICDIGAGSATLQFENVLGGMAQRATQWPYFVAVRYSTNVSSITGTVTISAIRNTSLSEGCPVIGQSTQADIQLVEGTSTGRISEFQNLTIDTRCDYNLTLQLRLNISSRLRREINLAGSVITVDSVALLPGLSSSDGSLSFEVYAKSENQTSTQEAYLSCLQKLSSLQTRNQALTQSPCKELLYSVGAELFNGSQTCSCNERSTKTGSLCEAIGGQCQCKPGVSGRDCGICTPGYFNFTDSGCVPCNCHQKGSQNGACDLISGACLCKNNVLALGDKYLDNSTVTDRTCSSCRTNYYGINNGTGCLNCECNENGSTSLQCDETGQCPCKDSVTGKKCDICKAGYFGFGENGCRSCNCSVSGSTSASCDVKTGECSCKKNVAGTKCSMCKEGFFNLVAYNPDGCQPCFCYQHSTNCTSALGFQSKLLKVNEPFSDLSLLLGDRHSSYGQTLSLRLESSSVIDLKDSTLLVLTGNGKTLSHFAPNETIVNSSLIYEIRLLEQNWVLNDGQIPTAINIIEILANLTGITPISKAKGQPVKVTYLAMMSAEKSNTKVGPEVSAVTYIEECTCSESTHTGGLSCQSCATGYRRDNTSQTSPYGTCVACNCSKRGATEPPECNELSGVCLNCRNGTQGEHCESCAPHVGGAECDVCEDKFWGLQADGCRACNCTDPGSKSPICNKTSGQCECASHVTGRTCDQCEENFRGLSSNGCVECDACYSLIKAAILPLRQLETDIRTNISGLENKDMNRTLGPFMTRFIEAQEDLNRLINFLSSMEQSESVTRSQLETFNQTLTSMEDRITTLKTNTTVEIEGALKDSERVLNDAKSFQKEVQDKTLSSHSKLAELQSKLSELKSLEENLKEVKVHLMNVANSSTTDQQIVNDLNTLNTTISQADQLVKAAEKVSTDVRKQAENNTSTLLAIESRIVNLISLAMRTLATAQSLANSSLDIRSTVAKEAVKFADLSVFKIDYNIFVSRTSQAKSFANSTQSLVTLDSNIFNASNVNALATVPLVDDLTNQSRTMGSLSAEWRSRSNSAQQRAAVIQNQVNSLFQDANYTLDTLRNFQTRSQSVKEQLLLLQQKVSPALNQSQQLIEQSGNVTKTLTLLQQTASAAKEMSNLALNIITQKQEKMKTILNAATALRSRLGNVRDLSRERYTNLNNTRTNIIEPGIDLCSASDSFHGFQFQLSTAKETVSSTLQQVANVTQRANEMLGQLRSLNKIDSLAAETLLKNVLTAQSNLKIDTLRATILDLQNKRNIKQAEINRLISLKDALKEKIIRVQTLYPATNHF